MLNGNDATRLIDGLKSSVIIPDKWTDFFEKTGPTGECFEGNRQFELYYHRAAAAITILPTLPALRRSGVAEKLYVKEISRAGVSLLHGEELFPGERCRLILADGILRKAAVVRCRRIQDFCFEISAKFESE